MNTLALIVVSEVALILMPIGVARDMREESGGTITGRVLLRPINESAPGVEVSVYRIVDVNSSLTEARLIRTVHTDDRGDYKVDGLVGSVYCLRVKLPGFHEVRVWNISVWSGLNRLVDVGISVTDGDYSQPRPSNRIRGKAFSSSGEPVPEATVIAVEADCPGNSYQGRSGVDGSYLIELPHNGRFIIYTLAPNYILNPIEVEVRGEKTCDLTVTKR